jgi:hypothetical protein
MSELWWLCNILLLFMHSLDVVLLLHCPARLQKPARPMVDMAAALPGLVALETVALFMAEA